MERVVKSHLQDLKKLTLSVAEKKFGAIKKNIF